ncbi:MAG: hypothetical protein Q8J68_07985 [Methanolobus sp.]|uniref:acylneuraminate cytidylyltransferase family protein n=1 Tax=Methanolobus sp. TaxID=1874737 RepID=UPI00272F1344|nr:hypothetical protein [Methanolobus sp.]MDP2217208.1 hypothetical protein [Methanolobus sp.]
MDTDIIVIVPARRDSKRLPHKNKMLLHGVPLWENSVNIAKKAGIKNIIVSTNDEEILSTKVEGVMMLERSKQNATDEATTTDVIYEVIQFIEATGIKYKTIALLQPTSPLLEPHTLRHALHQFQDKSMRCLIAYNQQYKPCGAFYIFRYSEFAFYGNSIYGIDNSHIYILPPEQAIDVDELWDWRAAQDVKAGRVINPESFTRGL